MENNQLPLPTAEKVTRWLVWGGIGIAAVFGINIFMPHVNTALGLVGHAFDSLFNIAVSFVGLLAFVYVSLNLAPWFVQAVNVVAERMTWALIVADPVAHLRIYLKEVVNDKSEFSEQLENVSGIMANVEHSRDQALEQAEGAQNRYNAARNQGRTDAQVFSIQAGKYAESAKRYEKMLVPLRLLDGELNKLFKVYEREAMNLATDIDIQSKEWEVAKATKTALDKGFKFLGRKSKKQEYADRASRYISDRYASQFGRLRTLKNMSRDLISTFDLETGMYDEQAYQRWQKETALVIDNRTGQTERVPMQVVNDAKKVPLF